PVLLLLVDLWPLRRFSGVPPARLVVEKIPFLVLAVPSALVTLASGHHLDVDPHAPLAGIALLARVGNAAEALVLYLVKMVWPARLAVLYPDPGAPPLWRATVAALALAAITAVAVRNVR